ncbi:hypothetical protein SLE2022_179640 [Rubroshorea leprosula]
MKQRWLPIKLLHFLFFFLQQQLKHWEAERRKGVHIYGLVGREYFAYRGAEGQCVQNSLCKGRTSLAAPSAIR